MPTKTYWSPVYKRKDVATNPENWSKVSSYVSKRDFHAINSVVGQSGGISHIIDHAIHLTAEYIRANDLTYLNSEGFIKWICERSFSEPTSPQQGEAGNDGRREEGACDRVENPSDVPTSSRSDAPQGSIGGGREGTDGKKKVGGRKRTGTL